MATPIENYIRSLLGRFSGELQKVWYAVKHHPVYKFTTNTVVSKTISNVQMYWQQAKDFVGWKASQVVSDVVTRSTATPKGKIVVTYTIPLARSGDPTTGHNSSTTRTFSTTVSTSATKSEVRAQIRDEVREWLAEHYSEKDPASVLNNIRIKGLE